MKTIMALLKWLFRLGAGVATAREKVLRLRQATRPQTLNFDAAISTGCGLMMTREEG